MALFLLKKFFKQRKVMSIAHYVFVCFLICGYFIAEGNEKQQITDIPTQASGVTSPIFRVVSGDGELKAGVYVRSLSRSDFQLAIPGEVLQTDLGPYIVPLELNNNQILPQLVVVDRNYILSIAIQVMKNYLPLLK